MCDDSKHTTATDTAILADFRRRFEKEFRGADANRFWVVMPGDRPGTCRVHVADDAETAAAILLGGPPKRAD